MSKLCLPTRAQLDQLGKKNWPLCLSVSIWVCLGQTANLAATTTAADKPGTQLDGIVGASTCPPLAPGPNMHQVSTAHTWPMAKLCRGRKKVNDNILVRR